ncbi:reverse transcriptase domain-containing protein [Musicola paradisiaca]|uniref:RNA-directed DNA polymerase n=1 Tax=Musicola paradisiaca (strain Ech703) TaxID=579405 RepID=C6C382_MUSP7|nr:reverse transcriptase domain-containing protein [Musicola paradisiaca]ACS87180.1 RNA-directed DNA polymerase (Reverse transcriptase) [Musicola paradisiaca Ech703]
MKTPLPLLFSYEDEAQFLRSLSSGLRNRHSEEVRRLVAIGLPPVVSWSVLSVAIGVSPHFLNSIIKNKCKYYRSFTISKGKGKKKRLIEAPRISLKLIQAWLAYHLSRNSADYISENSYAFIPGVNGIYEAAKRHCGSQWVLSIDLKDFFHYVNSNKIMPALLDLGYRTEQAAKIIDIVTLQDRLPQGAPSSPYISNIAFKPTDELIERIITGRGVSYTRYADDLTFSGCDAEFNIDGFKGEIINALKSHGWIVALDKVKISKKPNRLKVHGFLVHNQKPVLTKGYRNKLRTYRHLMQAGTIKPDDLDKIKGHLNYGYYIDRLNSQEVEFSC